MVILGMHFPYNLIEITQSGFLFHDVAIGPTDQGRTISHRLDKAVLFFFIG